MKEHKKIAAIRVALAVGLTLIVIGLVIWFIIGFSVGRAVSSSGSKSSTVETSQVNQSAIKEQPVTYFNEFLPFESEFNYDPNTQGFNLFYDLMRYFFFCEGARRCTDRFLQCEWCNLSRWAADGKIYCVAQVDQS